MQLSTHIYIHMKPAKLIISFIAVASALTVAATIPAPSEVVTTRKPAKTATEKILKPTDHNIAHRPKAPSRQRVTCSYDGEYLTVDFVIPEGECEVAIAEWYSGTIQTYTIDSTDLTAQINVGELYESTITISTESGNTYTTDLTATDDE